MSFYDEEGRVRTIPVKWTDLAGEEDPFVVVSDGRSWFRVEDLLALSEIIEDVRGPEGRDVGEA